MLHPLRRLSGITVAVAVLAVFAAASAFGAEARGNLVGGASPRATPQQIPGTAVLIFPPPRRCLDRREITIHLAKLAHGKWIVLAVTVNGKRFETVKGAATNRRIVKLTDLPLGRILVSVAAKTSDGRSLSAKHSYRMCAPEPGPPPTTPTPAPTPPPPTTPATDAVSLTSNGSGGYCAILSSSGVKCWGNGVYSGELLGYSSVPVTIPGIGGIGTLSGVRSLAGAGGDYCALLSSGEVACWGDNESNVPVAVQGIGGIGLLSGVESLVSDVQGSYCAVLDSGGAACWGQNPFGELGNGTLNSSDVPTAVAGPGGTGALSGIESLAPGYYSYCAILTSGGLDCWGFDAQGELATAKAPSRAPAPATWGAPPYPWPSSAWAGPAPLPGWQAWQVPVTMAPPAPTAPSSSAEEWSAGVGTPQKQAATSIPWPSPGSVVPERFPG